MNELKPQTPAKGISLSNSDDNYSRFRVSCSCGSDRCSHNVWVESEHNEITVTTYTTQSTNNWTETVKKRYDIDNKFFQNLDWTFKDLINGLVTRLKLTYSVWIEGQVTYEASIIMDKQTALNYAAALTLAITKVNDTTTD